MTRFSPGWKKALFIGTIGLMACDVAMLFATPVEAIAQTTGANPPTDPQLQQLQAQVQAQIKALQNAPAPGAAASAVPAPAAAPTAQAAVAAASSGNLAPAAPVSAPTAATSAPGNNILPPSPFANAAGAAGNASGLPNTQNIPNIPGVPAVSGGANETNMPNVANNAPVAPVAPAAAVTAAAAPPAVAATTATQSDINDAAFNSMVQNALPMSPGQIQKLRSMYMASQFAAASTPGTPPRPTATSVFVDLAPGATPPVVRLSQGFVTSMVFVDSTGAPWPIEAYDVGNPTAFNIQWDKIGNTLMVQATVLYTYGNLAVKLKGLDTPVMITLVPGQKAVDYRVDMRIQGYGPNARPFMGNNMPDSTSSELLNVLDGVPPPNSRALKVTGGDCQVWIADNKMYVRTRLNILSPGWSATLSSADGMHAYQMQPSPMLLVSQNGEVTQLKVDGF